MNIFLSEASPVLLNMGCVHTRNSALAYHRAPVTRTLPNTGQRKESVKLLIDYKEFFKFQVLRK